MMESFKEFELIESVNETYSTAQSNSINTVTNGSKPFGNINGVVVLSGQAKIAWLKGGNDKYTVHRIRISWTNVLIKKQPECKYRVQQLKEILQTDFPSVDKTLLKFGYKITTSALYVYCSLNTVQEQAQSTRSIKLTCHMHFNFLNFKQVAVLTGWNYKRFYCLGF